MSSYNLLYYYNNLLNKLTLCGISKIKITIPDIHQLDIQLTIRDLINSTKYIIKTINIDNINDHLPDIKVLITEICIVLNIK